jgi:hypothetical protein
MQVNGIADLVALQSSIVIAFIDATYYAFRGRIYIDGVSWQIGHLRARFGQEERRILAGRNAKVNYERELKPKNK